MIAVPPAKDGWPSSVLRHTAAALALLAIALPWALPIARHLRTAIPGTGAGDNLTFVWNVWWMRYVLHHRELSFFSTPFLFHPFGIDLTLHTHTALPALVAAAIGPASPVASQNLLILGHLILNFACAYALAFRAIGHRGAAALGGLIFGASPFVAAHLMGHFNLIAAWVLPLVCLLAWEARDGGSVLAAVLTGAALAAAAYADYYLFVYACLVVLLGLVSRSMSFTARQPVASSRRRRVIVAILGLLALDALVIAAIALTNVDRIDIEPLHASVKGVSNPVTFAWMLVVAGAGVPVAPRIRTTWTPPQGPSRRQVIAAVAAGLAILLPLLIHAVRLWRDGNCVSQTYQWRSAPAGIDAATLLLGHPYNFWWGDRVRDMYSRLHIDPIEAGGFIPVGALVLGAIAIVRRRHDAIVCEWTIAGAIFLTWALGPWLTAFGRRSPLILPAIAIRYLPIVANARIPGCAMVVVYLAIAMLAASGAAWLAAQGKRGRMMAVALGVLVVIECIPAPVPVYGTAVPPLYARLRDASAAGAVCELPFGMRDGFGEVGMFSSTVLLNQTVHERPIAGGFVARLPPDIARRYSEMPVLGTLLRLSSGAALPAREDNMTPAAAAESLSAAGFRYVVLNRRAATPDLVHYVESSIALRALDSDAERTLYEVMSTDIAQAPEPVDHLLIQRPALAVGQAR